MTPEELRKLMAEQEASPPVFAWDAIETKLAAPAPKRVSPFWWFITAAFLLIGMATTFAIFKMSYEGRDLYTNKQAGSHNELNKKGNTVASQSLAEKEEPEINFSNDAKVSKDNALNKSIPNAADNALATEELNGSESVKNNFSNKSNNSSKRLNAQVIRPKATFKGGNAVLPMAMNADKNWDVQEPEGKKSALVSGLNNSSNPVDGEIVNNNLQELGSLNRFSALNKDNAANGDDLNNAAGSSDGLSLYELHSNDAPEQAEIVAYNPKDLEDRGLQLANGNAKVIAKRGAMPISFFAQAHAGYGVFHNVEAIHSDGITVQRVMSNSKQVPDIASLQLEASFMPKPWMQTFIGLGLVHTSGSFTLEEVRSHKFTYAQMHTDGTMAFHYNPVEQRADVRYSQLNVMPTLGADFQVLSKIQLGASVGLPLMLQQSESVLAGSRSGFSLQSRVMYNLTPKTSLLLQMNMPQASQVVHSVRINSVFVGAGIRMRLN